MAGDEDEIAVARAACREVSGTDRALPSGPLHDAAEMARLVPTVMLFSSSTNGLRFRRIVRLRFGFAPLNRDIGLVLLATVWRGLIPSKPKS